MASEFRLPALGADMDAGTIVEWQVAPGSRVKRGDVVAVVETDKGAIDVEIFEDGVVRVVSPIEDTPAFRAGIKSGDLIVKIDDTATRGMPLSKAVEKMRGKPGTDVVLTIFRKGVDQPFDVRLTREEINVKSVRAKTLEPGYGYVRVRNFQERTGEDLAKALRGSQAKTLARGGLLTLPEYGKLAAHDEASIVAAVDELLANYPKAQVRNFDGQPAITELDALIAYLQMLGTLVDFSTYEATADANLR